MGKRSRHGINARGGIVDKLDVKINNNRNRREEEGQKIVNEMPKCFFVRQIRSKEHILTFLASTYRFIAFRQLLCEAKEVFCGSVFRCVVFVLF